MRLSYGISFKNSRRFTFTFVSAEKDVAHEYCVAVCV